MGGVAGVMEESTLGTKRGEGFTPQVLESGCVGCVVTSKSSVEKTRWLLAPNRAQC